MPDKPVILIVEDHPDTAYLLERMLRYVGFEAVAVPTGSEALRLVALAPPAVVVLDCNMPDMDGLDVLRILRAEEQTRHLPVIVYTADVSDRCRTEAQRRGATEFMVKGSVPWDAVVAAVRRHVKPAAGDDRAG